MDSSASADAMPLLSFVVIAYNVEDSIERCLAGLREQLSTVAEVVVVDDASTDGTLERIRRVAADDGRFRVLGKAENEGPHLARRSGAALSRGRFVYFMDGDDEVSSQFCDLALPFMLTHPADIYRFGIDVIAEGEGNEGAITSTAQTFNSSQGMYEGAEIAARSFSDVYGRRDTWSVTVCAYDGDFCRRACEEMTGERLDYMEDAYEFFVFASRARRLFNCTDARMLKYHFGAGRSGYGFMPLSLFEARQLEVRNLVGHVRAYADDSALPELAAHARWFEHACLQTLSNEWTIRLEPKDQVRAVRALVDTWGFDATLSMLAAPLTGRAIWVLEDDARLDDELLSSWRSAFDPLVPQASEEARSDGRVVRLAALLGEIDEHRRAHEEAMRTLPNGGDVREPRASRRLLDALLPPGSRLRRVLSAALRELRK